jgi:hypothetical protein
MIIGDLTIFRENEWRQESRDLEALALGDFEPVRTAIKRLYPTTALPLRAIPFVQRYVAELSGRYARPVVRRFRSSSEPANGWQRLQALYADSDVDAAFDRVERALLIQRSVLVLPMPTQTGRLRLEVCAPWQVQAEYSDPALSGDPKEWDSCRISYPAQYAAGQVIYGEIYLSKTTATRTVGGQTVGIYRADKANPFGFLPLVLVRLGDAYRGRWHGPVNQAVLNLQIALSCQVADNEHIVRHAAFPQKVIENAEPQQQSETISLGPDKVLSLIGTGTQGPQPTLRVVQGQVPVTELATFLDNQIRLYCAMLGLDPAPFLRVNTAVTASARLFSAQDRQELKDRIEPDLLRAERDVARIAAQWLAQTEPMPSDIAVDVTYTEPVIAADPLHDAQAIELRAKLGVESPVEVIAKERGISYAAAQRVYTLNLQGIQPPPAPAPPEVPA